MSTPYWERDQALHDTAYEIVERMIREKFKEPDYYVYNVNLDYVTSIDFSDQSYIIGYVEYLKEICQWQVPEGSTLPLHLEIKHILKCKENKILSIMKTAVFKTN